MEPDLPPPSKPDESTSEKDKPEQSQSQSQPESQSQRQSEEETADTASESETKQTQPEESASSDLEAKEEPTHEEANVSASSEPESEQQQPPQEQPDTQQQQQQPNLLDHVLHMPSPSNGLMPTRPHPSSHGDNYNNPPHLTPGPYVHHFDTYSLVRDLGTGGFSDEQSITIMKAVRQLLHNNLDLAKDSLISKSDVENESYLFKAACSELQSSLQTSRNSEMQTQRASRTQIQHESDILSQRLNQELSGLKDDIKGMFNDHKMSTREQQRSIDTSVQELNYKITVSLNSDGKSEIEGLRWILTRRAAFAIAISAGEFVRFWSALDLAGLAGWLTR